MAANSVPREEIAEVAISRRLTLQSADKRSDRYVSFDEDAVRAAAQRDPTGFVAERVSSIIQ